MKAEEERKAQWKAVVEALDKAEALAEQARSAIAKAQIAVERLNDKKYTKGLSDAYNAADFAQDYARAIAGHARVEIANLEKGEEADR